MMIKMATMIIRKVRNFQDLSKSVYFFQLVTRDPHSTKSSEPKRTRCLTREDFEAKLLMADFSRSPILTIWALPRTVRPS